MKKRLNLLLTMYFVLALELGYHFFLSVEKLLRYDSYVVASRERTIDTLFVLFVGRFHPTGYHPTLCRRIRYVVPLY